MKLTVILITVLILGVECVFGQKVFFNHDEANNKVDVYFGDSYFTSCIYPDDMEKQVLYPIVTASGKEITRGYPISPRPFERTDHPHHVGLWLNFGDVNGLDFRNNSFAVKPENKHRYGSIKFREVVIFDHPDNPNYPAWSHARGYGLFACNNSGGRAVDKNSDPVTLELQPGEKLVFKHKVVIGSDLSDKQITEMAKNFKN